MIGYIRWELKVFFSNRKNIILFILLLLASLYYALYLAPDYQPIESVNKNEIEARYEDRQEFLDNVEIREGSHPMTVFSYQVFPEWNEYDGTRLDALAAGDLHTYAEATSHWYSYSDDIIFASGRDFFLRYTTGYYTYGNNFSHSDGHYAYLSSAERYGKYANASYDLSIQVFEERTALQTLQRLLTSSLPYILLIVCLFLSNDIVMKDRHHLSIVNGFPLTPFKRLMLKGLVALLGSLTSLIVLAPAFLVIGFREGFGTLSLPVVRYHFEFLNLGTYESMSMGLFLVQSFVMILLWFTIIISLVLLMSIVLKNEFINLTIGIILFIEATYYQRGAIIDNWLSYLPTSYVQIGNIVSGYRQYILAIDSVTMIKGQLVLLAAALLIILLIWLVSRIKRLAI